MRSEFLPVLADETGGKLLVTQSSRQLQSAFVNIVAAFKARYVLSYSPRDVPQGGWHPIEVKLRGQKGEVRARRGYSR